MAVGETVIFAQFAQLVGLALVSLDKVSSNVKLSSVLSFGIWISKFFLLATSKYFLVRLEGSGMPTSESTRLSTLPILVLNPFLEFFTMLN